MVIPQSSIPVLGGVGLTLTVAFVFAQLMRKKKITDVKGKVVVVTGASSGLGEACVHAFYKAGAKVILCARRKNELERVKNEVLSIALEDCETHEPHCVTLDLTDFQGIPKVVTEIVAIHGSIDILINNGGVSYRGEIQSTALEVDQRVMDVNYFGHVALTKAVLPFMEKIGHGHIVAVSSLQGRFSIPYRSVYAASKHALQAFCDCLRAEVAHKGISVTVVSPGYIQTKLSLNAVTGDGKKYGAMDETTATGMKPERMAQIILDSIKYKQSEVVAAPLLHKLVILIRTVLPNLYFYIMRKRADKQRFLYKKDK